MPGRHVLALGVVVALHALVTACVAETKQVVASTQLTLRIDAEADLRAVADELRASLWLQREAGWERRADVSIPQTTLRWPLDIPIVASRPSDEDAELEVVVEAFTKGALLAQTRVLTHFLPGRHATVSTKLAICPNLAASSCSAPGCHGVVCEVCSPSGSCVPVVAQPPGQAGEELDAGAIDRDAAGRDAGAPYDARVALQGEANDDAGTADDHDARSPALNDRDAGGAAPDAGDTTRDAATMAQVPSCPVDHGCQAPYPCVPTSLGYTCRGQFADWPMPDPTMGAKTAPSYASDGDTVVDNVTKLEWQIGLPALYAGCTRDNPQDGVSLGQLCTRQEGRAYCEALVHAGHDDWRLPSLIEMASLFDTTRAAGSVATNIGHFGDVRDFAFVTDSTYANAPSFTWSVNYFARVMEPVSAYYARVRCVRAGAEPPFAAPADRYVIDPGADTVTDRATGLVWQRSVAPTKTTLTDAELRCSGGFRLPTNNELITLVDPTRKMPAIDPVAFPNTASDLFLASPRSVNGSAVSFETGELTSWEDEGYVRCVR